MTGHEINLLAHFLQQELDIKIENERTEFVKKISCKFDKNYFDGEPIYGYGGFHYNSNLWPETIREFQKYYGLTKEHSVLDIGCAKGFMIHDIAKLIPGIMVKGVDISHYAINHVIEDMRPHCNVACASQLPFEDHSFDLIISIAVLTNLDLTMLRRAIHEIERVKRAHSFIAIDVFNQDACPLTAKTIMSADEWRQFFNETGYTGDYTFLSKNLLG
jgi:ubiquinone/menaquinone biosynthesis C-methylase UbiE